MHMEDQVEIIKAINASRPFVISLLQSEKLPTADLPDQLENFYVAIKDNEVIGAIGLEKYGDCGLLRSMVVNSRYRSNGVASKLVTALERQAIKLGVTSMYLLTETASSYFERKGYEKVDRSVVPEQIKSTTEFSSTCPASATVMKKRITAELTS